MDARKSQTQKMAQETATGLANSLQSGLSYGYLLTMTRPVTIHPLPCVGCPRLINLLSGCDSANPIL